MNPFTAKSEFDSKYKTTSSDPDLSDQTSNLKALKYIVLVLFVLLLKRVHFLANETKGVTIQMKALDEYILLVRVITEEFIFLQTKPKCVTIQMKALEE